MIAPLLVDSGCTAHGFADREFIHGMGVAVHKSPRPQPLYLADGRLADTITEFVVLGINCGRHSERALFFLTKLAESTPLILGLPWLQRHDPHVSWANMSLEFSSPYCRTHCLPWTIQSEQAPMVQKPRPTTYRSPSVEHGPEACNTPNGPDMGFFPEECLRTSSGEDVDATNIFGHDRHPANFQHCQPVSYQHPYVTDEPEHPCHQPDAPVLMIESSLTPGCDYYRTRQVATSGPETRARMIRPPR